MKLSQELKVSEEETIPEKREREYQLLQLNCSNSWLTTELHRTQQTSSSLKELKRDLAAVHHRDGKV